jgi:hypothetical protein
VVIQLQADKTMLKMLPVMEKAIPGDELLIEKGDIGISPPQVITYAVNPELKAGWQKPYNYSGKYIGKNWIISSILQRIFHPLSHHPSHW